MGWAGDEIEELTEGQVHQARREANTAEQKVGKQEVE